MFNGCYNLIQLRQYWLSDCSYDVLQLLMMIMIQYLLCIKQFCNDNYTMILLHKEIM